MLHQKTHFFLEASQIAIIDFLWFQYLYKAN